jgi:AraC-like DNA-binding protein
MESLSQRFPHVPALLPGSPRAGPGPVRFSLDAVSERDRLPVYREFFGRSVCRFDMDLLDGVPFDVDLILHSLPGLQLFTGRVQGARTGRTRRLLADGTDDLTVLVNLGGPYLISQGGHEAVLGDGEATLVSEADSFSLSHHPPGGVLGLRVPRMYLAQLVHRPEDRRVLRIPRTNEALQLLTGYVKVAWHAPTSERGALQQLVVTHVHDLIALAVGATSDASELAHGRGLRAARLKAVKDYIARNLDQRDLSVGTVAARHGCTVRGVQRLFEAEGTTFTEFVLGRRLAHAYHLLSDARREHEKITTIALDCGFGDVSYFNRVFHRRYGLAPSDVRAQLRREASRPLHDSYCI